MVCSLHTNTDVVGEFGGIGDMVLTRLVVAATAIWVVARAWP